MIRIRSSDGSLMWAWSKSKGWWYISKGQYSFVSVIPTEKLIEDFDFLNTTTRE